MNVNIYHKHKDIIITTFIIASRAYLQHESDSVHTMSGTLARLNICYELYLELDVSMKLWCLLEPSSAQGDNVGLSRLKKSLMHLGTLIMRKVHERDLIRKYSVDQLILSRQKVE